MRRLFLLPLLALLMVNTNKPLHAQAEVEITPFYGAMVFLNPLSSEETTGIEQTHDNALAIGSHVGVRFGALSFEGTVAIVPTEVASTLNDPGGELNGLELSAPSNVVVLGVNALYNFTASPFVEMFVTAGGGLISTSADDPFDGFDAPSDPVFNVGAGGRVLVHPKAAIRFEIRDYVSTFDPAETITGLTGVEETQNNLLITVGISFTPSR